MHTHTHTHTCAHAHTHTHIQVEMGNQDRNTAARMMESRIEILLINIINSVMISL